MADNTLFPAAIADDTIDNVGLSDTDATDNYTGYKMGPYFDGKDFVRDGAHRIIAASGADTWKAWCRKCLVTERGASIYYPDTFGIRTVEALGSSDKDLAENILSREIREAMMRDPYGRCKQVDSLTFSWGVDSVEVYLEMTGIDGSTIALKQTIGGGTYAV